jgi:hypothetical protein
MQPFAIINSRQRQLGSIASYTAPSQVRSMSVRIHRYKVGQTVVALSGGFPAVIPRGRLVVLRVLPPVDGEPHYIVRGIDGHERAVLESQIRLVE